MCLFESPHEKHKDQLEPLYDYVKFEYQRHFGELYLANVTLKAYYEKCKSDCVKYDDKCDKASHMYEAKIHHSCTSKHKEHE